MNVETILELLGAVGIKGIVVNYGNGQGDVVEVVDRAAALAMVRDQLESEDCGDCDVDAVMVEVEGLVK
jgi:hypothetical protein